jgi:phytoene synthase
VSAASEITRKAKSNLAIALKIMPREKREDMVIFYAFCRTIDDIADDLGRPTEKREELLNAWENGLLYGFENPDELQQQVVSLRDRHEIPNSLLVAIIQGCRMDVHPQRFQTWEDLSGYIWKVACAVGLVSIRLFGCKEPISERYAIALGHALQMTNILRDVAEDFANNRRIYLPLEDLAAFGYTESDLAAGVTDERFLQLMTFEAERAKVYFQEAAAILPFGDQHALVPARAMAEIYHLLLNKMRAGQFRIFKKRFSISKARKLAILSKHLIARSTGIE